MRISYFLYLIAFLQREGMNSFKFALTRKKYIVENKGALRMHLGHDHSHGHSNDHDHDDNPINLNNKYTGPTSLWGQLAYTAGSPVARIFVVALLFVIPAFFRRKLTKLDIGAFGLVSLVLSCFQSAKEGTSLAVLQKITFGF